MAQYTNFVNGFNIQSAASIDKRILLTKAEMRTVGTASATFSVPDTYFCICSENGKLYLYNSANTVNADTGKYLPVDATLTFDTAEGKAAFEAAINNSTSFTNLETKVGDAEAGTGIAGEVKVLQTDVTTLKTDVNTLKPEVARLKEEVEDPDSGLAKRIAALEDRTTEAEERMAEIERRLAAIKLDDISGTLDGGVVTA